MKQYRLRIRMEIVESDEDLSAADAQAALEQVEAEAVEVVGEPCALSLDDLEEVLLDNGYATMRQLLSRHFAQTAKKGRPSTPLHPD